MVKRDLILERELLQKKLLEEEILERKKDVSKSVKAELKFSKKKNLVNKKDNSSLVTNSKKKKIVSKNKDSLNHLKKLNSIMKKELNIDREISLEELERVRDEIYRQEIEIDSEFSEEDLKKLGEIMRKEVKIDTAFSLNELRKQEKKLKIGDDSYEYSGDFKNKKLKKLVDSYRVDLDNLKKEISKTVVGHDDIVDGLIRGFLANGHVLIEGVPGIAKTILIRSLAVASGCKFSRIQFTVDLLPTDITGVTTYDQKKNEFTTIKGPVFANFIIADEINRAPPKSQSAMLEAMQEKQVTIGKETHMLPKPFFVMANNNPLESSGTYPLPEAQVDRFLFKIKMGYTTPEHEEKIIDINSTINKFEDFGICPVVNPKKILEMQDATKEIFASQKIKKYIVSIVGATRDPKKYGISLGKYIEWGCSPRASIGLTIASKADALMRGDIYISPQNVKNVAEDVLRHRLILNYRGQAENVKPEDIIDEILKKVPLP